MGHYHAHEAGGEGTRGGAAMIGLTFWAWWLAAVGTLLDAYGWWVSAWRGRLP